MGDDETETGGLDGEVRRGRTEAGKNSTVLAVLGQLERERCELQ
jgi:hypothetical protein